MLTFERTAGGYKVLVNNKHFGWIDKDDGFFSDSTVIKEFIPVSANDLRQIADKAEEVRKLGY